MTADRVRASGVGTALRPQSRSIHGEGSDLYAIPSSQTAMLIGIQSTASGGVGLSPRAHMISRVRIRARGIECFGGNSDDRAACVAQAIVADRTDQQSTEPDMLPSSDDQ